MKVKCETNSFGSEIVLFCDRHHYLYRYSIMTVSIRIGWFLYRLCTDSDCIVLALMLIYSNFNLNILSWENIIYFLWSNDISCINMRLFFLIDLKVVILTVYKTNWLKNKWYLVQFNSLTPQLLSICKCILTVGH